jgi:hypothetical protein
LGRLGGVPVLIRPGQWALGLTAATLLWLPPAAAVWAEETVVLIAHADLSELEELTIPLLRQLYLGRRSRIGGRRLHWFEPPPGSDARRAFAQLALGRSELDLERYWLEQALSGGPLPPREIATAEELVERVAARKGAVGYLSWEALGRLPQHGIRVVPLRVEGRLLRPADPDYPLREHPPGADPTGG